ncbi:hypothetical protein vseg_016025 [Gypsophila vaccaria]
MEYLSRILGVVAQQETFKFHPMCGHMKLNHLLFADDLLLFCKGNEQSIMWILRGFSTFSLASGLDLNKEKTNIYFNGVTTVLIDNILQVSGFKRGSLPFKYLGVPISSKKLTKNEGMKLLDRITARIIGWGTRHLSYAGRLVLVQSVLSSLHSYWASIFLIPAGIMKTIDAYCRNFLWAGKSEYKKAPNVKWDTCCLPKEEGGLGIKQSRNWNSALLGKYAWWLASKKDHLWVKWVNHVYMKGEDWTTYTAPMDSSWSWRKIVHTFSLFKQAYMGSRWLNDDKEFTVAAGYHWLRKKAPKVNWRFVCWNTLNVPKTSFIYWAWMHQKLLTKDRLNRMGVQVDNLCDICRMVPETHDHLLIDCPFSRVCLRLLQRYLKVHFRMQDLVAWSSNGRGKTKLQRKYIGACHAALVYAIWKARNEARMNHVLPRPERIIMQIKNDIHSRFLRMNTSDISGRDTRWLASLQD